MFVKFVIVLCLWQLTYAELPSTANPQQLTVIDPKIIGGQPISILTAPWQVSVRLKLRDILSFGDGHICGGSVITQRVVVTAAHCVANTGVTPMTYRKASEFTLVMGSIYLYDFTQYTRQFDVLEVVHNPGFDISTLVNDVALFFINGYIPPNYPTIAPIKLNQLPVAAGTDCMVTGWGRTASGYISQVLMGATVPIVSSTVCNTSYTGSITQGMVCAGYLTAGGIDACQGDSGGPLVCNNLLTGIVSWGERCALPGYPGVYTNVSHYYNWITLTNSTFNYTYYDNSAGGMHRHEGALWSMLSILITLIWFYA